MRVLIIGGTGLISTSITRSLLERGDHVTLFNRGLTENRSPAGAHVIQGDRKDYAAFENRMTGGRWDSVIDMIGFAPDDVASALRAFRGRVGQYIFCSTVCVYGGELSRLPATEEEPRTPTAGYGRNKVACEDLLMDAYRKESFPITIIRPSHSYGEGGTIVHTLGGGTAYLDRLKKGRPVVVHGDGSSLWASCHVDDVSQGFVGALGNPKALGEAYNVTGEQWMTWNDYTAGVANAIGGQANIVHIPTDVLGRVAPKRAGGTVDIFQYNSVFDNSKAKADLGFEYTIPWITGVRRTVEWLESKGKVVNCEDEPFDDRLIAAWERMTGDLGKELE